MNSSKGTKGSGDFDVLDSQMKDSSFVYQIPIKKIYEKGFENVKKPTDLEITFASEDHFNEKSLSENVSEKVQNFIPPKDLINHLDFLIVKKNLPLRTLKFDIEFSKSTEEIAKYLEDYIEKSNIIEQADLDKLFGFIGYGRENEQSNSQEVSKKSGMDLSKEDTSVSLDITRSEYVETLVPALKKLKKDKEMYLKIMSELGGNTDMPLKREPKELVIARKEYEKVKKDVISGIEGELDEIKIVRDLILEKSDAKIKGKIDKALLFWDKYESKELISDSLASGDLLSIEKIVDPESFFGMRDLSVSREETKEEISLKSEEKNLEKQEESEKVEEKSEVLKKPTEFRVVDIPVAEKAPLPQNTISLRFEDRDVHISKEVLGNMEKVVVFLGDKEIAVGEMVKGKPKIKINKEYKSGFLFADTFEERALKYSIKTLNS